MQLKNQLLLLFFLLYCYIGCCYCNETSILLSIKWSFIDPLDRLNDWKPQTRTTNNNSVHCNWTGVSCNELGFVEKLDLSRMNLSGKFSNEFQKLNSLTYLNLCSNGFSSFLPNSFTNLTSLKFLDVSQNQFSGNFPLGFGKFHDLTYLNASGNNFEGNLPNDLSNATVLEILDLRGSYFVGSIPKSYMNLQNSKFLGLSRNNLIGKIPFELGKFSCLENHDFGI